jgi:hypothetical protein
LTVVAVVTAVPALGLTVSNMYGAGLPAGSFTTEWLASMARSCSRWAPLLMMLAALRQTGPRAETLIDASGTLAHQDHRDLLGQRETSHSANAATSAATDSGGPLASIARACSRDPLWTTVAVLAGAPSGVRQ